VAGLCVGSLGLLSARCFLNGTPGGSHGQRNLRRPQDMHELQYTSFEQPNLQIISEDPKATSSVEWAPLLTMAAVVGLVVGITTTSPTAAQAQVPRKTEVSPPGPDGFPSAAPVRYAPNGKPYINPSEDVDEDELVFDNWLDRHWLEAWIVALLPVGTFLTFWVLGSLEVI